jgi:hypothetical protein
MVLVAGVLFEVVVEGEASIPGAWPLAVDVEVKETQLASHQVPNLPHPVALDTDLELDFDYGPTASQATYAPSTCVVTS